MAMGRCPDCGGRRAWSAKRCPRCGSERESNELAGAKAIGEGAAVMGASFLLMGWPDRIYFLAVVLGFGFTGNLYWTGNAWAAWIVWCFIGGTLGLVLCSIRLILELIIGKRWSWGLLLAASAFCIFYCGPGYMAWLEEGAHR
jgi:hypothetical protein